MKGNLLLHFFPPPTYLSMPYFGIDLSDRSLKYVQLIENRTEVVLGKYGEVFIPEGIISGGVVKDEEKLREIIAEVSRKVGISYANISLPEEKAYIVAMKTPPVSLKEMRDAIELQLEEYVPLPSGEVEFDYTFPTGSEKDHPFVSVSAIHRGIVSSYSRAFVGSGVMPVAFEIEAEALSRSLVREGDPGTFLIVDFGRTRTGFSVVSHGVVWFSSTVAIGGDAITEAIQKKSGLPREAALNLKETRGLSRAPDNKEMFANLTPVVSVLKDEVSKHYIYWNSHGEEHGMPRRKIEKILMCGGDANIPGLLEYLSSGLETIVDFANPWVNIFPSFDQKVPPMPFNQSLRYATALGLALRNIIRNE